MRKYILSALILMAASLQTWAQGFRVYNNDGTVLQFSLRTDSIVFYDGIGSEQDLGLFTPVNQCIFGTWYKSKSETVTFNEDGTSDYNEYGDECIGGKYEFFPFQGNLIIYSTIRNRCLLLHVAKLTKDSMIMGRTGASDEFYVYTRTQPKQLVANITLNETSITLHPDEIKTLTATVLPEDADNPTVTWKSSNENVAEVNKNGRVITNEEGTCTITCRATDGSGVYAECQVTVVAETNIEIPGFGRIADAVDLGLSVKWASWNVGASKIADYGGLYGAGDPTGLKTSTNYLDYYWVDGDNICGTEYDLAHVKWGGTWRLPSIDELKELKENCTWTHNVIVDEIKGSIAKGPNGNELFFPYGGSRGGANAGFGNWASVWSGKIGNTGSTSYIMYSHGYLDLDINLPSGTVRLDACECQDGQSIRPVCEY